MPEKMRTVLEVDGMPKVPHFVIMIFGCHHITGDKRPKDNPGHGGPVQDGPYTQYRWTANRNVWITEITKLSLNTNTAGKFFAFKASAPAEIEMKAQVHVKMP